MEGRLESPRPTTLRRRCCKLRQVAPIAASLHSLTNSTCREKLVIQKQLLLSWPTPWACTSWVCILRVSLPQSIHLPLRRPIQPGKTLPVTSNFPLFTGTRFWSPYQLLHSFVLPHLFRTTPYRPRECPTPQLTPHSHNTLQLTVTMALSSS